MKKVIVLGLGSEFVDFYSKRFPYGCFEIVCATDMDSLNAENAKLISADFCEILNISQKEYDYIIISSKEKYRQYYNILIEIYNVNKQKILSEEQIAGFVVDDTYAYNEFYFSFGEKNPDKTFYIIRPTYAIGLFACAGRTMAEVDYAKKNNWIPIVDMQNYPNMYLATSNLYAENSWEYFFEQVSPYSLQEVYSSKNVVFGDVRNARKQESWTTGGNVYKNKLWNECIELNTKMKKTLDMYYEKLFKRTQGKKVLGVLLRGTDYVSLQPDNHPIQPSATEMIKIVFDKMKEWECEFVFLSTEDEKILQVFKEYFGTRLIYTDQKRYENTGNKYLASIKSDRENDEIKRGEEYLTTIMLLSKCDYLICSKCGGSNVVKMINGDNYKEQITVDKGIYGIDNEVKTIFDAINIVLIGDSNEAEKYANILSNKFQKNVLIYSEEKEGRRYIKSFDGISKIYCVIIDNDEIRVADIAAKLSENGIQYAHIDFFIKNYVDISILKRMNKFSYIDENNNEIYISENTCGNIKVYYHKACNSIVNLKDIRVHNKLQIKIYGNSGKITIGDKTTIEECVIEVTTGGFIDIGEECLISRDVNFLQKEGHHIFDIISGRRINDIKGIIIGNHVWIERNVNLYAGASIADNSIVRARADVYDIYEENNVMIGGNPSRILHTNIIWARDDQILDYDNYRQCQDNAIMKYITNVD